VGEAIAAGVSASRLRRRDLLVPFRGVRAVPTAVPDPFLAYAPLLRPGHVFAYSSAAQIWGIWLPRAARDDGVEILAIGRARPVRMSGVRSHHAALGAVEVAMVGGHPVTAAADTVCMLADRLTVDQLVEAGDSVLRRHDPPSTLSELTAALDRHRGRRGIATLRRALPLMRAECDSPRETRLRLMLVRGGLPEPRVNPVVSAPGALPQRFGDLVYEQWRVIVEYDGHQHRLNRQQYASDIERLEQLAAEGWLVIRVLAEHLLDAAAVVARVAAALETRGWRPKRRRKAT
jgi:hypothetical protein